MYTQSLIINLFVPAEGEFLVKKFGFGREFGLRLTAKIQIPKTKLPPNS